MHSDGAHGIVGCKCIAHTKDGVQGNIDWESDDGCDQPGLTCTRKLDIEKSWVAWYEMIKA